MGKNQSKRMRETHSTRSASTIRRGGDRLESRPDNASQLKTLKIVPTAIMRHK